MFIILQLLGLIAVLIGGVGYMFWAAPNKKVLGVVPIIIWIVAFFSPMAIGQDVATLALGGQFLAAVAGVWFVKKGQQEKFMQVLEEDIVDESNEDTDKD